MITVWIDELTNCLKDASNGEIVQTEVIQIKRASFLRKYNKKTGWFTNWEELLSKHEIYALVIQGTVDIQGLVALAKDTDMQAVYVAWMCASPENQYVKEKRYLGVGGHLFAIAAQKSVEYGFEGYLYGFAANKELLEHYSKVFHAEHIGILHPYHFVVDEVHAKSIMEVYDYEWTDENV